jgi:16S rRNA (cytidine1402-2'-O)-methyltransferase
VSGTLWLVATPIGNLEDITLRALRILRECDAVLAEDTRRTKVLLNHHGITTRLESLHAHSSEARIDALAKRLAGGEKFALVTDAGTPIVSDPGEALVSAALTRDVRVEGIPGASAVTTALCVAGLKAAHFRFVGFLPRSGKRRRNALAAIASDSLTTVLFEAPQRTCETVRELCEACGPTRRAALCRELTKLHEEVLRGSLGELVLALSEAPRGEITLVIEGRNLDAEPDAAPDEDAIRARALALLAEGTSVKDTARALAGELGIDRRDAYRRVLELRGAAVDPDEAGPGDPDDREAGPGDSGRSDM